MPARIKDDDDVLELYRLYTDECMSLLELAVEFGLMEDEIRGHFHRLSLPLRRPGAQTGKRQRNVSNRRPTTRDSQLPNAVPVGPKSAHRRRGYKV